MSVLKMMLSSLSLMLLTVSIGQASVPLHIVWTSLSILSEVVMMMSEKSLDSHRTHLSACHL